MISDKLIELTRSAQNINVNMGIEIDKIDKWSALCDEVLKLSVALRKNDYESTRAIVRDSIQLFQRASGVGMTYWVGYRPEQ